MIRGHFILENGRPKQVGLYAWARWFENADRSIDNTTIDQTVVSTVFLGLDHNFSEVGPPLLFETMVFCDGEELQGHTCRHDTLGAAKAYHADVVAAFRAAAPPQAAPRASG